MRRLKRLALGILALSYFDPHDPMVTGCWLLTRQVRSRLTQSKRRVMKNSSNWSWCEGTVDRTSDHFELRYGSANDSGWDQWLPLALVGPPINGAFVVQFLINQANESQAQVAGPLIDELNFYLLEKGEPDPWTYAQYHAGTLSNVYSSIHWSFFPKRPVKGQMKREPRSPRQLDLGATFGGSK